MSYSDEIFFEKTFGRVSEKVFVKTYLNRNT